MRGYRKRIRRGVSASQAALFLILVVVGIAIGYFAGQASAPSGVQTVTQTVERGAGTTVTITATQVLERTVTQAQAGLSGEIPIGALLPLGGSAATEGARHRAAVLIAIQDLNNFVSNVLRLDLRFTLLIEDTGTDPAKALEKLQSLYARGVRAVVGPYTSAELNNVLGYANSNKIFLCSTSTSPALALKDYAFRIAPNDLFQSRALARLLTDYGIKYLVIMNRDDAYGRAFADRLSEIFTSYGGVVLGGKSIAYDPKTVDFTSYVAQAASLVRDAISRYGADGVGMVTISFEEVTSIMNTAAGYPELSQITWFGTDVVAANDIVIDQAGSFAAKVKTISTVFGPTRSPLYDQLLARFKNITGSSLIGTYAVVFYDCVWLIGLATIMAGSYDGEAILKAMPDVGARYFGASGWTLFDENGDRASGSYDIYAVVVKGGKPVWIRAGVWDSATDTITWFAKI